MKKILFLLMLFGFMSVQAQDNDSKEKIKALKTAYITQHLELSSQEAQKFWPIYNKYDQTEYKLRKAHRSINCNINDSNVSAEKAKEMLREYQNLEVQRCNLRKQMIAELAEVLPPQKVINLKNVEHNFHKKLLNEYRSRKAEKTK